jgi:hypothetical protein
MAMMIKILDNDQKPICVYDGHRWVGRTNPIILSEAMELMVIGLRYYREARIIQNVTRDWDKPAETAQK